MPTFEIHPQQVDERGLSFWAAADATMRGPRKRSGGAPGDAVRRLGTTRDWVLPSPDKDQQCSWHTHRVHVAP